MGTALVDVLQAEWSDCGYLRDVCAGLRPVEVGSIAGQNDHSSGRVRKQLLGIEFIAKAENSGNGRVNTVLGVAVRASVSPHGVL